MDMTFSDSVYLATPEPRGNKEDVWNEYIDRILANHQLLVDNLTAYYPNYIKVLVAFVDGTGFEVKITAVSVKIPAEYYAIVITFALYV